MTKLDEGETGALRDRVAAAWERRELLDDEDHRAAVRRTIALLDEGHLRVATPPAEEGGDWTVNAWIKQAIVL